MISIFESFSSKINSIKNGAIATKNHIARNSNAYLMGAGILSGLGGLAIMTHANGSPATLANVPQTQDSTGVHGDLQSPFNSGIKIPKSVEFDMSAGSQHQNPTGVHGDLQPPFSSGIKIPKPVEFDASTVKTTKIQTEPPHMGTDN